MRNERRKEQQQRDLPTLTESENETESISVVSHCKLWYSVESSDIELGRQRSVDNGQTGKRQRQLKEADENNTHSSIINTIEANMKSQLKLQTSA